MKYLAIVYAILILTICSCQKNRTDSDTRIIQKDTMISLMADLEIVESAIKLKQAQLQRDSLDKLSNMAFDSLYAYYKISPANFKANLKYYQKNMTLYQEMLDEMIIILSKKKDSISIEPEEILPDTIKKTN